MFSTSSAPVAGNVLHGTFKLDVFTRHIPTHSEINKYLKLLKSESHEKVLSTPYHITD